MQPIKTENNLRMTNLCNHFIPQVFQIQILVIFALQVVDVSVHALLELHIVAVDPLIDRNL